MVVDSSKHRRKFIYGLRTCKIKADIYVSVYQDEDIISVKILSCLVVYAKM